MSVKLYQPAVLRMFSVFRRFDCGAYRFCFQCLGDIKTAAVKRQVHMHTAHP